MKKNGYICICMADSRCCTPETQQCKSTILQYKIKLNLKLRVCLAHAQSERRCLRAVGSVDPRLDTDRDMGMM